MQFSDSLVLLKSFSMRVVSRRGGISSFLPQPTALWIHFSGSLCGPQSSGYYLLHVGGWGWRRWGQYPHMQVEYVSCNGESKKNCIGEYSKKLALAFIANRYSSCSTKKLGTHIYRGKRKSLASLHKKSWYSPLHEQKYSPFQQKQHLHFRFQCTHCMIPPLYENIVLARVM